MTAAMAEHVDVLIVGAGLSGIAAGYYLQTYCPEKSYAILEARDAIGGTWDLFRYPGVRSDSDMYTLGYSFRPWPERKAIADGPAIRTYVRETASAFGIDKKIRFQHRVRRLVWSTEEAGWTVDVESGPDQVPVQLTCSFVFMCSGYYDYDQGYTPDWPGVERFQGRIVHPQQWPQDLDYAGKRIVVIGSGATAVTLVPALAERAAHVTMLQRSPTYIVARPSVDTIGTWLHRRLPTRLADSLTRWKNILLTMYFYGLARRRPEQVRATILRWAREQLEPEYDGDELERDFSPRYNPWDQRLCLVPDGDLFHAMKAGRASIVTDTIGTFTETGIRLASGKELEADIIVTATGLTMRLMSGVELTVDGTPVDLGQTLSYKGLMFSDVPNLAQAIGYTNASWTLKCELIAGYVCRLLKYMDAHGYTECLPKRPEGMPGVASAMALTSGYVERARASLPRQGGRLPWRTFNNYLRDLLLMRFGPVNDGTMQFSRAGQRVPVAVAEGRR
jgi:cation diffusion facilitator CzcD-associated flavoprotein CzcO